MTDLLSQWRIDRSINPSHVITTLTLAATLIWQFASLDKRVSVLEVRAEAQTRTDQVQDTYAERSRQEMRGELREINTKLDKLVERQGGR